MADWKTRLAVSYTEGATTTEISPIDSFTPSFTMNAEVLHSLERTHMGIIYSPESISFSMTVKAIGDVAAQLTALAIQRKRFNLTLQEKVGDDWSFAKVLLTDCVITSATPTSATVSGAPSATFSGVSLAASSEDNQNVVSKLPAASNA
ncbi:hypothetical protein [Aquisphaera insulae]|uniref:hypothetical protein n=1 Tax=Aquisphaera insulae TaxID=2712864 RepID=UPI0013EB22B0|nr:hypothetical protein [Aquisphaera insulae]